MFITYGKKKYCTERYGLVVVKTISESGVGSISHLVIGINSIPIKRLESRVQDVSRIVSIGDSRIRFSFSSSQSNFFKLGQMFSFSSGNFRSILNRFRSNSIVNGSNWELSIMNGSNWKGSIMNGQSRVDGSKA